MDRTIVNHVKNAIDENGDRIQICNNKYDMAAGNSRDKLTPQSETGMGENICRQQNNFLQRVE